MAKEIEIQDSVKWPNGFSMDHPGILSFNGLVDETEIKHLQEYINQNRNALQAKGFLPITGIAFSPHNEADGTRAVQTLTPALSREIAKLGPILHLESRSGGLDVQFDDNNNDPLLEFKELDSIHFWNGVEGVPRESLINRPYHISCGITGDHSNKVNFEHSVDYISFSLTDGGDGKGAILDGLGNGVVQKQTYHEITGEPQIPQAEIDQSVEDAKKPLSMHTDYIPADSFRSVFEEAFEEARQGIGLDGGRLAQRLNYKNIAIASEEAKDALKELNEQTPAIGDFLRNSGATWLNIAENQSNEDFAKAFASIASRPLVKSFDVGALKKELQGRDLLTKLGYSQEKDQRDNLLATIEKGLDALNNLTKNNTATLSSLSTIRNDHTALFDILERTGHAEKLFDGERINLESSIKEMPDYVCVAIRNTENGKQFTGLRGVESNVQNTNYSKMRGLDSARKQSSAVKNSNLKIEKNLKDPRIDEVILDDHKAVDPKKEKIVLIERHLASGLKAANDRVQTEEASKAYSAFISAREMQISGIGNKVGKSIALDSSFSLKDGAFVGKDFSYTSRAGEKEAIYVKTSAEILEALQNYENRIIQLEKDEQDPTIKQALTGLRVQYTHSSNNKDSERKSLRDLRIEANKACADIKNNALEMSKIWNEAYKQLSLPPEEFSKVMKGYIGLDNKTIEDAIKSATRTKNNVLLFAATFAKAITDKETAEKNLIISMDYIKDLVLNHLKLAHIKPEEEAYTMLLESIFNPDGIEPVDEEKGLYMPTELVPKFDSLEAFNIYGKDKGNKVMVVSTHSEFGTGSLSGTGIKTIHQRPDFIYKKEYESLANPKREAMDKIYTALEQTAKDLNISVKSYDDFDKSFGPAFDALLSNSANVGILAQHLEEAKEGCRALCSDYKKQVAWFEKNPDWHTFKFNQGMRAKDLDQQIKAVKKSIEEMKESKSLDPILLQKKENELQELMDKREDLMKNQFSICDAKVSDEIKNVNIDYVQATVDTQVPAAAESFVNKDGEMIMLNGRNGHPRVWTDNDPPSNQDILNSKIDFSVEKMKDMGTDFLENYRHMTFSQTAAQAVLFLGLVAGGIGKFAKNSFSRMHMERSVKLGLAYTAVQELVDSRGSKDIIFNESGVPFQKYTFKDETAKANAAARGISISEKGTMVNVDLNRLTKGKYSGTMSFNIDKARMLAGKDWTPIDMAKIRDYEKRLDNIKQKKADRIQEHLDRYNIKKCGSKDGAGKKAPKQGKRR